MHKLACVAVIFSLALSSIAAQSSARPAAPVSPNTRVRVQLVANPVAVLGLAVSMDPDSLVVAPAAGNPVRIRLQDIARLDTVAGQRSQFGRGLAVGLGVGAMLGGLIGAALYTPCEELGPLACVFAVPGSAGEAALVGAVAAGIACTLIGGIIGATRMTDRWGQVDLSPQSGSVHFSAAPTRRGVMVSGSITF